MLMLLFGFIGLMLDLSIALVWGAFRLALYLSPLFLIICLLRSVSRY